MEETSQITPPDQPPTHAELYPSCSDLVRVSFSTLSNAAMAEGNDIIERARIPLSLFVGKFHSRRNAYVSHPRF